MILSINLKGDDVAVMLVDKAGNVGNNAFWSWWTDIKVRAFHFKISFWIRVFLLSNKAVTSQGAVRNLPGHCLLFPTLQIGKRMPTVLCA